MRLTDAGRLFSQLARVLLSAAEAVSADPTATFRSGEGRDRLVCGCLRPDNTLGSRKVTSVLVLETCVGCFPAY